MEIEKLGRYKITSELGQGAMGVVYKAEDPLIGRPVAIKTIKLDLSTEELANFEDRFYREAKSAGCLNHPSIVTIYDVGKSDNMAYMAMELLEGQALRDILDAHTALAIEKIADIAAQVADGLAYAHEKGIVHRDIKPANIMIVRDGAAKITDFGIAQMPAGSRTLAGAVLGSPKYMSPEQVIGQQVDGRSDIFSLGVVLYEMLTGESPFDGDNISAIMYRILNQAPPSPKTLNPRLPEAFDYIVARALAKHPQDRYQDAGALAHDLRNHHRLSIPRSFGAAGGTMRTLERRATPRAGMGDETLFLNQVSGGLIGNQGGTQTGEASRKPTSANPVRSGFWNPRKLLLAGIPLLLLAFAATVMWGRLERAGAPSLPQPRPQTAVPLPQPSGARPLPTAAAAQQAGQKATTDDRPTPSISGRGKAPEKGPNEAAAKIDTQQKASSADQALLTFAITPWGEIYIDGIKAGVSPPLKTLRVPAGKHRIEIRNLNFAAYSVTLDIKPNTARKIKYIFR